MKNLFIKLSIVLLFVTTASFKSKTTTGIVMLDVSYVSSIGGGTASITNTDTNVIYNINAIDTSGDVEVPYGNYVLTSASTNSCNSPLMSSVTTSTGDTSFSIDSNNNSFTIYVSCY